MTSLQRILAANVRLLMDKHGLKTQKQAAQLTGLAQTQIGNVLRGDKRASLYTLDALARGFKVEPWQLLAPPRHLKPKLPGPKKKAKVVDINRR